MTERNGTSMLSISRRTLLAGISTLPLAGRSAWTTELQGASSSGRICLSVNGLSYYAGFYSFLNILKQAGPIEVVADGAKYSTAGTPGSGNSAWGRYLDEHGELVNPLPNGVTHLHRVFFAPPPDPEHSIDREGQQWVLKWDGTARHVLVAGAKLPVRKGNRITWIWPSNPANMWITFESPAPEDPPRNIRMCEARYETRLDAGEIFDPGWVDQVRQGAGIVRLMCWQGTNSDHNTLRFSDIPSEPYYVYGGEAAPPIKAGMPLQIMTNLAREVNSHPWVCIPNVLGTPKLSSIETISNANPAVVVSPGHAFSEGDSVIPYGTEWPHIEKRTYTVVDADPKAGTFALGGVDSSSFGPFRSGWAWVTAPYDLPGMTRELAPFAAHFRDHVGPPLVTYFEFGNELWNFMFHAPHWLAAQARSKFRIEDNNRMAGYLAAHCMRVVGDVYGPQYRRRWRGVLSTQTVNPGVTEALIAGAKQYVSDHAPSMSVSTLFDDLAVTGYWYGPLYSRDRRTEIFSWMETSETRWRAGLEPTKYSSFNRVVNQICAKEVKDNWQTWWPAQKRIADAIGLGMVQYEGGNHDVPIFLNDLNPDELTRFMEFYYHSTHTEEDAANYRTMFEQFVTLGGKYPAKFAEAGSVSRFGAWGGLRYLGDVNPVWNAVVAFNGRS